LDKSGGINLNDCEKWSRRLEALLDEKDIIPHSYSLEVSSPGVERPLKKLKDFQRFMGERVAVRLYAAQDGQKNFKGILTGVDESFIQLKLEDQRELKFERSQVAKSHLAPEFSF